MYSFSGLSTYDTRSGQYSCPYSFYIGRILEIPSPPTEPLLLGSSCHSVIEVAVNEEDETLIKPLSQAVATVNDLDAEEVEKLCSADEVLKTINAGGGITEEYFEMPSNPANPFSATIRGYIDYHKVEKNRVVLKDWKSNRATYMPIETKQLALYAAYLSQKYNLPVTGQLVFLRHNVVLEHDYTRTDMEEALEWAEDISCEIDAGKQRLKMGETPEQIFRKQLGSNACNYCGYKHICLATPQDFPIAVTSIEEAVQTSMAVLQLEEKVKTYKELLKKFIATNGDVDSQGIKIAMEKSEYLFFDMNARIKTINGILSKGLPIGEILKIGSDAQKELINKYGWEEKDFLGQGAVKRSKNNLKIGNSA